MAPNLAVISIPAYYLLSVVPHSFALNIACGGDISKFDNRNPRSSTYIAGLKEKLSPEQFAKFERCESAHKNNLESFPLFASAVFVGLLADGVGKGGILTGKSVSAETLRFVYSFLAVRLAYNVAYVTTRRNKYTLLRSGLWVAGLALVGEQFYRAAGILGEQL
ncbi:hypothetical protein BDZ85DRAFT_269179 [Elsinoe ampelina]|uniref:Membrane-associated, eicosanoid/glutathione metabolism protein n=1 Tax=Elsinoe ampelina TaxID=302913 RepID=A0A6A6G115_9PEZI|nr:hypothetical protein BDZ85DRAFT_269179 [Elsinoe ampelina]